MDLDHIRVEGARAEARAVRHLQWRGWRIAARNWHGGGGELDIVASRWRTLLIVEVRRRLTGMDALVSIDRAKLDRTLRAAQALIRAHQLERYYLRYDLIGIGKDNRMFRRCDILHHGQLGF
jgi:putative endonuclease